MKILPLWGEKWGIKAIRPGNYMDQVNFLLMNHTFVT